MNFIYDSINTEIVAHIKKSVLENGGTPVLELIIYKTGSPDLSVLGEMEIDETRLLFAICRFCTFKVRES